MNAALREAAQVQEDAYLKTLATLIGFETPSNEAAAGNVLVDYLELRLAQDGWQVERLRQSEVGDQLIARLAASGERSSLLLAHYDTVWPLGTLAQMPFKRDGERVYGPGVLDMKAGISSALHAKILIDKLKLELAGPVTLLLSSDEEIGSHHSRKLIETLAREHERVLVLEPGRDDGALKLGRKAVGDFFLEFLGRSAHAGNNPKEGASALRELAQFLLYVEDLNDDDAQTSVNLTVAEGGSATNVIAEQASANVDVRIMTNPEAERIERAIRGYQPRDSRVQVKVSGGINRPPLELTTANQALFAEAKTLASNLGFELEGAVVGGGSDGNFTSALGIATLDGLGSVGEGPHARHEHIRLSETLDRLALLTALLTRSG